MLRYFLISVFCHINVTPVLWLSTDILNSLEYTYYTKRRLVLFKVHFNVFCLLRFGIIKRWQVQNSIPVNALECEVSLHLSTKRDRFCISFPTVTSKFTQQEPSSAIPMLASTTREPLVAIALCAFELGPATSFIKCLPWEPGSLLGPRDKGHTTWGLVCQERHTEFWRFR